MTEEGKWHGLNANVRLGIDREPLNKAQQDDIRVIDDIEDAIE